MTPSKLTTQARDAQIVAGIQKHLQTTPSLPLAGATYSPADLVTLLGSRTSQAATVASTHAAWLAAVAAEQALSTKLSPILRGLRQYVLNSFGAESPVIADFGFTATVRKTPVPATLVAAAAKAKATRAARHTMGTVQKKRADFDDPCGRWGVVELAAVGGAKNDLSLDEFAALGEGLEADGVGQAHD